MLFERPPRAVGEREFVLEGTNPVSQRSVLVVESLGLPVTVVTTQQLERTASDDSSSLLRG